MYILTSTCGVRNRTSNLSMNNICLNQFNYVPNDYDFYYFSIAYKQNLNTKNDRDPNLT